MASTGCGLIHHINEEWAIGAMIGIREAEQAFKSANGYYGRLDQLAAIHVVSGSVPSRIQYGYQFTVRATADSYFAFAVPTRYPERGSLRFYLDQSGIIRTTFEEREADVKDPPVNDKQVNPTAHTP